MPLNGDPIPRCPICVENLGKYGGPSTLPCGHNYCLQCIASQQNRNPECPLCRAPFSQAQPLSINTELRDLIHLATTLHTVEHDGWQTITATKGKADADDDASEQPDVTLVPTAPPMHISLSTVLDGGGDLLSLEPPKWLPDSHAQACGLCNSQFQALRRLRHHCRLCGGIFCQACSGRQLLLPPKFQQQQPQRVCESCAVLLEPLQPFLAGTLSKAVQPAIYDVTDASAMRSWFNLPLTSSLESDIYKATNIVRAFARVGNNAPERNIPSHILKGAAGFAVLSTVKVGMGWSGVVGTGLVVGRRADGWSAPSAISLVGLGWGFQLGGAVSDILIILRNRQALQAFCGRVHIGGGLGASLAIGPVGRHAEAALRLGIQGGALCYSYSLSAGVFAGISIEGSAVCTRDHINLNFYGRQVTTKQLLLEDRLAPPIAAAALYSALEDMLVRVGAPPLRLGEPTQRDILEPPSSPSSTCRGRIAAPDSLHSGQLLGALPAVGYASEEDEFQGGLASMFED